MGRRFRSMRCSWSRLRGLSMMLIWVAMFSSMNILVNKVITFIVCYWNSIQTWKKFFPSPLCPDHFSNPLSPLFPRLGLKVSDCKTDHSVAEILELVLRDPIPPPKPVTQTQRKFFHYRLLIILVSAMCRNGFLF
jgi:hypothetical protein